MKKILKTLLLCFMLLFTSFSLSGCLGFFEDDETLMISRITTTTLENGNIEVRIIYENEDVSPTTFIIPKGAEGNKGEAGNGIKEIITQKNETNTGTILKIVYTDNTIEPTVVEVSDGMSIQGVSSYVDEETQNTLLEISYTDGTKSEPIIIPKGVDGKDGNGITSIDYRVNRDFSVTLTFKMSNEEEDVLVQIPAPQRGEDGRGIDSIVSVPDGDTYKMIITYTDGDEQEVAFARPNKWFSEGGAPTDEEGIDGDLWYDFYHHIIYVKQNNTWLVVLDLMKETNQNIVYTITFDLNDNDGINASMPSGTQLAYLIANGQSFYSSGYTVPLPTREGYEFKGWYLVKDPTIINTIFADLTTVNQNMTLYALWEEITE